MYIDPVGFWCAILYLFCSTIGCVLMLKFFQILNNIFFIKKKH